MPFPWRLLHVTPRNQNRKAKAGKDLVVGGEAARPSPRIVTGFWVLLLSHFVMLSGFYAT